MPDWTALNIQQLKPFWALDSCSGTNMNQTQVPTDFCFYAADGFHHDSEAAAESVVGM